MKSYLKEPIVLPTTPPHITERIIGQCGCFVYSKTPNRPLSGKQLSKVRIEYMHKNSLRRELNKLGINYATIFPGIDGICNDINSKLIWDLDLWDPPF